MSITTTTTTYYTHADGRRFILPDEPDAVADVVVADSDDTTTISYLIPDPCPPSLDDALGGTGVHFMSLHCQADADRLSEMASGELRELFATGRARLVERYEHGGVIYGLVGESSAVDRRWDVTPVAGAIWAEHWPNDDIEGSMRAWLDEINAIINGDAWILIDAHYHRTDRHEDWVCVEHDAHSILGLDNAVKALEEGTE